MSTTAERPTMQNKTSGKPRKKSGKNEQNQNKQKTMATGHSVLHFRENCD